MKVAFYTVDLFPGREHLMPWRVILETAKYLNQQGVTTEVISIIKERDNTAYCFQGVQIMPMKNELKYVVEYVNRHGFDSFVFQVKWRDGLRNLSSLSRLQCKKIAYFDGGIYAMENAIVLAATAGLKTAKPYLAEAFVPKTLIIQKLKKYRFDAVVTFTATTGRAANRAGMARTQVIYPGKDEEQVGQPTEAAKKPYLLFAGSPHAARGSIQLLKAFDQFADRVKESRIIFLMRKDVGSSSGTFENTLAGLRNRSKIEIVRENLSRQQLLKHFKDAKAVVLPFLTIPSEIPLTFFEVLSTGTPVITFKNGGTTDYLSPALAISNRMTAGALARKMEEIWLNENIHNTLSVNAITLMDQHPDWKTSGETWHKLLKAK